MTRCRGTLTRSRLPSLAKSPLSPLCTPLAPYPTPLPPQPPQNIPGNQVRAAVKPNYRKSRSLR
jgi:hypothetical protein